MQNPIEAILFGFTTILSYKTMKRALAIGLFVMPVWSAIGYFIWDELVSFGAYCIDLVAFALVLSFFGNMILERIFKEKYSSFSLLVVFASAAFWSLIWFFESTYLHAKFLRLFNWLAFETVQTTLVYLLGLYFIYCCIIVTMLLVATFLVKDYLKIFGINTFYMDRFSVKLRCFII